jgi:hypothetical protein
VIVDEVASGLAHDLVDMSLALQVLAILTHHGITDMT